MAWTNKDPFLSHEIWTVNGFVLAAPWWRDPGEMSPHSLHLLAIKWLPKLSYYSINFHYTRQGNMRREVLPTHLLHVKATGVRQIFLVHFLLWGRENLSWSHPRTVLFSSYWPELITCSLLDQELGPPSKMMGNNTWAKLILFQDAFGAVINFFPPWSCKPRGLVFALLMKHKSAENRQSPSVDQHRASCMLPWP